MLKSQRVGRFLILTWVVLGAGAALADPQQTRKNARADSDDQQYVAPDPGLPGLAPKEQFFCGAAARNQAMDLFDGKTKGVKAQKAEILRMINEDNYGKIKYEIEVTAADGSKKKLIVSVSEESPDCLLTHPRRTTGATRVKDSGVSGKSRPALKGAPMPIETPASSAPAAQKAN